MTKPTIHDIAFDLLEALREARPLVERFATEEARGNKVRGKPVHQRRDQLARLDAAIAQAQEMVR